MQHFLCQCIELFLFKHRFNFLETSFRVLLYLEYMKKLQSPRLEACYCNTDDTRVRPSPEIVLNQDSASDLC